MSKTSRAHNHQNGSTLQNQFDFIETSSSNNSVTEVNLLFSQLSLRTTKNPHKAIFKISYNGDQKRIPQEKEINFADIIKRCVKSFTLDAPINQYVLKHEERGNIIANQEQMARFIPSLLTQSENMVKFTLIQMDNMDPLMLSTEVGTQYENVQQLSSESYREPSLDNNPCIDNKHLTNPILILKLLQALKQKGSISIKDVKLMNLQNSSLNTQEKLEQLTQLQSMNTLLDCEQVVQEIINSSASQNLKQSNAQIALSEGANSSSQASSVNKLAPLKQSINEIEAKLNRLKTSQANNASSFVNQNHTSFINRTSTMMRSALVRNSQHCLRSTSLTKQSFNLGRPRTISSNAYETPGGGDNSSFHKIQTSMIVPQQVMSAGGNSDQAKPSNDPRYIQQQLMEINSDDESINLLSNSIHKISEKNESLEISLALDESYIKKMQ